ncbi:helix-turn-helix domain-containing protein [Sneathiella limimaris]|uniref:helix-turn-helix domain-containing protein n=1 Tax=Sneathiella limimaris TaxID=1964213 RepID=UPI0019D2808D|nr:helix-turn-helix domain-containing protein [Sneathiella limimaris]
MQVLDIGEVVSQTGLAPSTLRYYEEKGLIQSCSRKGLRRQYLSNTVLQLSLITLGRSAGFTLDEIADLLKTGHKGEIDRQKLVEKADELDETIKTLTAMRNGLRHAANCPAPSHLECPKFQRYLKVASRFKAYSK